MGKAESRLQVQKTYTLYIGGKFVRGENDRVISAQGAKGQVLANDSRASRKDCRDAVVAARAAFPNWSKQSACLRWRGREAENPYWILDTVEMKTTWHPIGL
jgi:hypothetical protein